MASKESLQEKHLHLDCFAGIAGDMFLGAVLDLGVPEEVIRSGLDALPLDGYEMTCERSRRMGIVGCDVKITTTEEAGHGHRTWKDIREMIDRAELPVGARRRAIDIFSRLATVEARLHDTVPEQVEFHEVGAVDSIVDIVGAALALEYLAPTRVTSRAVPLGHGTTRCAHGILPVPSPAALELLKGARVEDGGLDVELCTPTGAAIVAHCVESFGPIPSATLVATGYGAGDMSLPDRPNLLRLALFEPQPRDSCEQEAAVVEANVDNMSPEWCGHIMERMFAAGARDVWYTPILMKKERPAITISALCPRDALTQVGDVLLAESTTIGLRYYWAGRRVLGRKSIEVDTAFGSLTIKLAMDGDRVLNAAPEYAVCKAAADKLQVPLKEVYAAAIAAYQGRKRQ